MNLLTDELIEQYVDSQRAAIMSDLERLRALWIRERDLMELFSNGPREEPDWDLAERYGDPVHDVVYWVRMQTQSIMLAQQELASRKRPN